MADREHFWRLEHLSDRQLLERLKGVLRTQRRSLAELIAHLGEVEERRLHLAAAHGSLFSYCVQHLGMSEDEACRRIELARLARKFPLLFSELASGRIGLSVALLLKSVLTLGNHRELIAAARGASLRTAREMLAVRFPSPDVPSRIRKLPERSVAHAIPVAGANVAYAARAADVANASSPAVADANAIPAAGAHLPHAIPPAAADAANPMPAAVADVVPARAATPGVTSEATTTLVRASTPQSPRAPEFELASPAGDRAGSLVRDPPAATEPALAPAQASRSQCADPCRRNELRQRIDPLSAERYRVQFTADASLKQKLELARDLLRHSNPSGDLAPIVSRAIELLLQQLLQRRFGARHKDTPPRSTHPASHAATAAAPPLIATAQSSTLPSAAEPQSSTPSVGLSAPARVPAGPSATTPTSHIARAARRAVLERDGLGCCWVDAEGERCGSTAWLELDHNHPSGKGGSSEPENLRLLCRAHNRFAAERAYGREHVERAIQARQRRGRGRCQSGWPPSSSSAPA